ncbi:hypothetical protein GCM10022223_54120 [Kineosporia mesophila]|uniref:Uncharacterized protein n=1 Tax=Kineosporia mesophila TaxID=566012 RepID=A0ABP7AD58_9ACTN
MSGRPEHDREPGGRPRSAGEPGGPLRLLPSPRAASVRETDESGEQGPRAGEVGADRWPDRFGPVGERDPIAEAALMRRRLGSYQRGLTSARRTRPQSDPASTFSPRGASLFISTSAERGADQ